MAFTAPGVYISEGPFATNTTTGPTTNAAAFLGTAARGPVTPTAVSSWNAYKSLFGELSSAYDLGYAVYHFFANGGRTVYVTRVVGSGAANASAGLAGAYSNASATVTKVKAANPGTWGNNLTVDVTAGLVTGQKPSFNLIVKESGTEVERWSELSLNPDDSRFVNTVVNTYSSYIRTYDTASLAGASYSITAVTGSALASGADGASLSDDSLVGTQTAWANAIDLYDSIQGTLTFNVVGKTNATIINDAISYVEGRGNSFLIIDPSATATTAALASSAISGYTASSYAAVYYPMLTMSNPAVSGSAALRTTYPGGAVAGLFARVEAERSVAKAPAGYAYDVRNAFGLVNSYTEAEVGTLYTAHVNTFKAVPGAGVIINGARTLKKTDVTKYVTSRRTLNYVKANLDELTKFAVFEPNGERLWSQISARIANFLGQFWGTGGLKGNNADEAYYIVCDETNNTAATIEQGEVHVEVGVALQTPAEFIVINVNQFIGGNNIQETA